MDPTLRRLALLAVACVGVISVIIAGVVLLPRVIGPERSVKEYCKTWVSEGQKLHEKWNDQGAAAESQGNPLGKMLIVMGAPLDVAEFFDKLAKVAPEEIEPDVTRYRDAWRSVSKALGEKASDPSGLLIAMLSVAGQTYGTEQRIDRWTAANCKPYFEDVTVS